MTNSNMWVDGEFQPNGSNEHIFNFRDYVKKELMTMGEVRVTIVGDSGFVSFQEAEEAQRLLGIISADLGKSYAFRGNQEIIFIHTTWRKLCQKCTHHFLDLPVSRRLYSVVQGCKRDHPRPDFLSPSPFFAYLLLKPTQKWDGKPTQKPSLLQP